MALDGITLGIVKEEIIKYLKDGKVEKIHQPSKNELVFIIRTRGGAFRLFMSCDGQSSRVHLTRYTIDNPKTAPMLCMLFRKYLVGASLKNIRQVGSDRILIFDFNGSNEIGDRTDYHLICEIMAQRSNIILCDKDYIILDAVKRIDETKSSYREILPSCKYELPPQPNKINLIKSNINDIVNVILSFKDKKLSKAVLDSIEGFSPLLSREISYRVVYGDKLVDEMSELECERLEYTLNELKNEIINEIHPSIIYSDVNIPFDFSFTDIRQYGNDLLKRSYYSVCEVLDDFYFESDRIQRTKRRASDLVKILNSSVERVSRKINNRRIELDKSENREMLRVYAELITTNQYKLTDKSSRYVVENYYDNNNLIEIPVNPALTAQQNAQKYYKEYRKATNAEKMLHNLINEGEQELQYLESVLDTLTRASTDREINEIREELIEGGYLRRKKNSKGKKEKPLPPFEYLSSDGFKILVGRNNVQNDFLTLKTAKNYDMWLHTQKIPGSHTIIVSDKREISNTAIIEAASICAYHSNGRDSYNVPVDYTLVKNVKKPSGAKPGKVIYDKYNTVYVTPTDKL